MRSLVLDLFDIHNACLLDFSSCYGRCIREGTLSMKWKILMIRKSFLMGQYLI